MGRITPVRIGKIILGKTPRIIGIVGEKDIPTLGKYKNLIDLLEVRIDLFKKQDPDYLIPKIKQIKKITPAPLLLTIRTKAEGGKNKLTDEKRLALFEALLPHFSAVDIELASQKIIKPLIKKGKKLKKKTIVSYHDLKMTPPDSQLESIIRQAHGLGADLVKLAVFARSTQDVIRLLNLTYKNREKNIITISLGNQGAISRIIFPLVGSLLTYGPIGKAVAPGQISLSLLHTHIQR